MDTQIENPAAVKAPLTLDRETVAAIAAAIKQAEGEFKEIAPRFFYISITNSEEPMHAGLWVGESCETINVAARDMDGLTAKIREKIAPEQRAADMRSRAEKLLEEAAKLSAEANQLSGVTTS